MLIYVKHSVGKITDLEVQNHDTISSIDPQNQRLMLISSKIDDFDDNKMLSEYNIKQGDTLQLVVRLRGGGPAGFQFQDLSKSIKKTPWSKVSPRWRTASYGLNLEGYCKNCNCEAYNKDRVIVKWGYRDFDFYYNEHECLCPLCNKHVEPITCGFYNTHWKYEGVKKVKGCPPEEASCDWKFAEDDGYTTFKHDDVVSWYKLVIRIRP
ncbi:hypothetical protein Glove_406g92 [Diversispora epigaea]|uniref:Ubiquitin-like domain-containing protein n=1 Tax=Diversispora epigaea TaxID=1348612 RepID=A0A397GZ31_9GLOM|nr:hypothetical protein Glove_406g92 [Diversispora epigaea]